MDLLLPWEGRNCCPSFRKLRLVKDFDEEDIDEEDIDEENLDKDIQNEMKPLPSGTGKDKSSSTTLPSQRLQQCVPAFT